MIFSVFKYIRQQNWGGTVITVASSICSSAYIILLAKYL